MGFLTFSCFSVMSEYVLAFQFIPLYANEIQVAACEPTHVYIHKYNVSTAAQSAFSTGPELRTLDSFRFADHQSNFMVFFIRHVVIAFYHSISSSLPSSNDGSH